MFRRTPLDDKAKIFQLHPNGKEPSWQGQRRQDHGKVLKRSCSPDTRRGVRIALGLAPAVGHNEEGRKSSWRFPKVKKRSSRLSYFIVTGVTHSLIAH